jgi:hypothetical protein
MALLLQTHTTYRDVTLGACQWLSIITHVTLVHFAAYGLTRHGMPLDKVQRSTLESGEPPFTETPYRAT